MPDPHQVLRCLSDKFTPVRDTRGRLLGCIPLLPDTAEQVLDARGNIYPTMFAAQVCVMVDLETQTPTSLDGFVALDDTDTDLAIPAAVEGDDEDLARGV